MLPVRLCARCETLLTEASDAIRRHANATHTALEVARTGDPEMEKYREGLTAMYRQSFHQAQSAWDAYREHLIEHGFIPPSK